MKTLRVIALAAALVLSSALAAVAASPTMCQKKVESFDFVVDYSGSMMMRNATLEEDKIIVARNLMTRMNELIPALDYNGGLHTITPNGTLLRQGSWVRAEMAMALKKLKSSADVFGRMTALGTGFQKYEPFLAGMKRNAAVILFTDGDENTGEDVYDVVRSIYGSQKDIVIHYVSFADTPNGETVIKNLAAMNSESIVVRAEELATNEAALEKFVYDVFCIPTVEDVPVEDDVLVLRGVNFAFDSSALDDKARAILDEAANIIKQGPANSKILLTGWTDYIGTDAYNMALSQRRANSVRAYLADLGIPESRMVAVGRGKSFKYNNETAEGRYLNRRTEISFEE